MQMEEVFDIMDTAVLVLEEAGHVVCPRRPHSTPLM